MSIPVATTTITILRDVQPEDGYADPTRVTVATGVRAVLSEPAGSRGTSWGTTVSDVSRKMTSDLTDILPGDVVVDQTGYYDVAWVSRVPGFNAHITAGLVRRDHL